MPRRGSVLRRRWSIRVTVTDGEKALFTLSININFVGITKTWLCALAYRVGGAASVCFIGGKEQVKVPICDELNLSTLIEISS